jgi:SAM-dependent methyltransferase
MPSLVNSVRVTKAVRRMLDHGLPVFLRDSAWFMRPLFHYWFKGHHVREAMEFKDLAYALPEAQLLALLGEIETRADDRETDLGAPTVDAILARLHRLPANARVLDVGSGRGYLARVLGERGLRVTGIDLRAPTPANATFDFVRGDLGRPLPFPDDGFDLVVCCHVLEHVKFPALLAQEMWRTAKAEVWVVVPKQRYAYYTPDLHLHFFPNRSSLPAVMGRDPEECFETEDEWFYRGTKVRTTESMTENRSRSKLFGGGAPKNKQDT